MRIIPKEFIESSSAPERTDVIWVKLVNGKENPDNMEIEDMLQYINGSWRSIVPGNSGSNLPEGPWNADPDRKIVVVKNTTTVYQSTAGSIHPLISSIPPTDPKMLGTLITALKGSSVRSGENFSGFVFIGGQWVNMSMSFVSQSFPEYEELPLPVYMCLISFNKGNLQDGEWVNMSDYDWPEGFENLKATWDDVE